MEGVDLARFAVGVVKVPVDAVRVVVEALLDGGVALEAVLHEGREVVALMHPGRVWRRTDELLLAVRLLVVAGVNLTSGKTKKEEKRWT